MRICWPAFRTPSGSPWRTSPALTLRCGSQSGWPGRYVKSESSACPTRDGATLFARRGSHQSRPCWPTWMWNCPRISLPWGLCSRRSSRGIRTWRSERAWPAAPASCAAAVASSFRAATTSCSTRCWVRIQRRAVRFQGHSRGHRPTDPSAHGGQLLVLRYGTSGPGRKMPTPRARSCGGLDGRPGLQGGRGADCPCRPSRHGPAQPRSCGRANPAGRASRRSHPS